jgi:hypothetical protein
MDFRVCLANIFIAFSSSSLSMHNNNFSHFWQQLKVQVNGVEAEREAAGVKEMKKSCQGHRRRQRRRSQTI